MHACVDAAAVAACNRNVLLAGVSLLSLLYLRDIRPRQLLRRMLHGARRAATPLLVYPSYCLRSSQHLRGYFLDNRQVCWFARGYVMLPRDEHPSTVSSPALFSGFGVLRWRCRRRRTGCNTQAYCLRCLPLPRAAFWSGLLGVRCAAALRLPRTFIPAWFASTCFVAAATRVLACVWAPKRPPLLNLAFFLFAHAR